MGEPGCIALQTFAFAEASEEFALIKHAPFGICFWPIPLNDAVASGAYIIHRPAGYACTRVVAGAG